MRLLKTENLRHINIHCNNSKNLNSKITTSNETEEILKEELKEIIETGLVLYKNTWYFKIGEKTEKDFYLIEIPWRSKSVSF